MDVQRLRILRELADRGSVTAVAAALSYTPSAVSQQLKTLAHEVGVALTEPAGRGLRLTEAGHALAVEAEDVLAAVARAEVAIERLRTVPTGQVRMAIFQSGARMLLAGLLRRLDGVEGVELSCRDVDMTPGDVAALTADYDIVVCHRDEAAPAPSRERWRVIPLLREPLDVFLPPGHPLTRRRRLRLSELAGQPWIRVAVGWPVDDVLRSIAMRTGTAPRVVQRINDFSVTEELVAPVAASRCCRATRPTTVVGGDWCASRWPGFGRHGLWRRCCGPARPPDLRWAPCWTRCAPRWMRGWPDPAETPEVGRFLTPADRVQGGVIGKIRKHS